MLTLFYDDLATNGHSRSAGRTAVFEYLSMVGSVTPRKLAADMVGKLDRASLYRTITLFREMGIIDEIGVGNRRTIELSDRYAPHHHHLRCRRCGKVANLNEPKLEKYLSSLSSNQGFKLEGHVIELTGICAGCQSYMSQSSL